METRKESKHKKENAVLKHKPFFDVLKKFKIQEDHEKETTEKSQNSGQSDQ